MASNRLTSELWLLSSDFLFASGYALLTFPPRNRRTGIEIEGAKLEIIVMKNANNVKISPGRHVRIVLKKDQRTGKLTEGIVKEILTRSPTHPHGIKVRLESGEVGRVKEILQ
jgi:uncharacterized repeat protein (TIGR03833 family)